MFFFQKCCYIDIFCHVLVKICCASGNCGAVSSFFHFSFVCFHHSLGCFLSFFFCIFPSFRVKSCFCFFISFYFCMFSSLRIKSHFCLFSCSVLIISSSILNIFLWVINSCATSLFLWIFNTEFWIVFVFLTLYEMFNKFLYFDGFFSKKMSEDITIANKLWR